MSGICLTLDVDWAPDRLLEEVLARLRNAGVRATFFATHSSDALRAAAANSIEVGLHPDFVNSTPDETLAALKAAYPGATGARSHRLTSSSPILQAYARNGLRYESNVFLPYHPSLQPVTRFAGFSSIPFYWSDDHHLMFGRPFEPASLRLDVPGLKVLNFHPVHICLNTANESHYERAKAALRDDVAFDAMRAEGPGIGTLFDAVLGMLDPAKTTTLGEVADAYLNSLGRDRSDD